MNFLKKILSKIIQIILPNICITCPKIISHDSFFCQSCWSKLQFIGQAQCKICGYPFEFEGVDLICSKCLQKKPHFDQALSLLRYNKMARKAISLLKYGDQSFLAKKFGHMLFNNFKKQINNCDIIIAVPMHYKRLKQRKFNQAILIAQHIAKLANKNFKRDFLIKKQNTIAQIKLPKKDRENNLKNAFIINEKYLKLVKNKNILIIDDVITTQTTIENCAKILKKHGAKKVIALTIAKTALI